MRYNFFFGNILYTICCIITQAADTHHNYGSIQCSNFNFDLSNLNIRGGNSNDDLSNRPLGKDRELIHFSVDLKWVWNKISDKMTYLTFIRNIYDSIKDFAGIVDSKEEFKGIAIDLLHDIRLINPSSHLKLILGDIKTAEWLAKKMNRIILIYIEDGDVNSPSDVSMQYRKVLSDPVLGDFINNQVQCIMCIYYIVCDVYVYM